MFVNSDFLNYDNIVEVGDNYVCLAKTSSVSADWQNPRTIDVIYQYFTPSILTIETTKTFNSSQIFESIETSDDFFDRPDCPQIICCELAVIFFVLFILNGLTRFVKKGGVFFGS